MPTPTQNKEPSESKGYDEEKPAIQAARRIMRRCEQLRQISAMEKGYFRTYLTPEHRLAAEKIATWMVSAGLSTHMDAAGNILGRYEGRQPKQPALLLGSHFDTVRDAGRYDGMLGILSALECVAAINRQNRRFPFAIEVYAFADEEGARFPSPFIGSRSALGLLTKKDLTRIDGEGITLAEALNEFGLQPEQIWMTARQPKEFLAYLELHIEQGPCLQHEGLSVAAVSGIQGQTFIDCTLKGQAGHAGTVPMHLRQDALAGAADAIIMVEAIAREYNDVVATVGRIAVKPGATNVIPGRVSFSIDLRSPSDHRRKSIFTKIARKLASIAEKRNLKVDIVTLLDQNAISCDPRLTDTIAEACGKVTGSELRMTSGAGHDAEILAHVCPVGMLFVRCQDGISHHPEEAVTPADVADGYRALLKTIEQFAATRNPQSV